MPEMPPSQMDAHPGAALRRRVAGRPANLEGFDLFDLHLSTPTRARARGSKKEQDQAIEKVQFPVQEQRG
jgi:hypothetical protein